MKPKEFAEANVTYGKNQPEYLPLPAHRTADGTVTTCWQLSEEEIKKLQETGEIWLSMLTFNQPLQPVMLQIDKPNLDNENRE